MKKMMPVCCLIFAFIGLQAFLREKKPTTKEELGKLLFFDPLLSGDRTVSCASCHKPGFAFADTSKLSEGINKKKGIRNTPSAMNLKLQPVFFWDGRAKTLEEQALAPIQNPDEMNLPIATAIERLRKNRKYSTYFQKIFGANPDSVNLGKAIAAYEQSLDTDSSAFDEWKLNDDSSAVSPDARKGFALFNGKAKCSRCHFGSNFTLNEFRNIGLFNSKELNDSGRILITGKIEELGKFKIPGLRNVAITAPYMHNGIFKTLREVIDYYNDPDKVVADPINRDTLLNKPLLLKDEEKNQLEAFLISITDKRFKSMRKLSSSPFPR